MTHAQMEPFLQGHDRQLGQIVVSERDANNRRESMRGFLCANISCRAALMSGEIIYVCRQGDCGKTSLKKRALWCFDCGNKDPSC